MCKFHESLFDEFEENGLENWEKIIHLTLKIVYFFQNQFIGTVEPYEAVKAEF